MHKEKNNLPNGYKMTELGPLPEEWQVVRLIDHVGLERGNEPGAETYNKDGVGVRFIRVVDISGSREDIIYSSHNNLKMCLQDDILITFDGSPGIVKTGLKGAYSSGIRKVNFKDTELYKDFTFFVLQTNFVQNKIREYSAGVTIKHASKSIPHILIPLPPLPEQRAIAEVLRTVQKAKETTERVIAALRELKKSLMRHLFTFGPVPVGNVGATDRSPLKETEIGPIPEHWQVVRLGEVVMATQYGISLRGSLSGKYPILRMNNLVDGRLDTSDMQYVDLKDNDLRKFKLNKGEILFNRTNSYDLVGKTALFDLDGNFVFASYLIRLVADFSKLVAQYLNYYLNWDIAQNRLRMLATRGVSQSNINATKLKGFQIPLPPLPEQQEIARILQAVDNRIQAEEGYRKSLEALFKTLLHELMTGKRRVRANDVLPQKENPQ